MWAVARYDGVKAVLGNWEIFTTAHGVAMDDKVNAATSGPGRAKSFTSDPPLHDKIRNVTGVPVRPRGLREIEEQEQDAARALVDDICARGEIYAMEDVPHVLPMNLVREFVRLPPAMHGRGVESQRRISQIHAPPDLSISPGSGESDRMRLHPSGKRRPPERCGTSVSFRPCAGFLA